MKLLVIGSGGREHAIAWKLINEPDVGAVYCVPGNDGMVSDGIVCESIANDLLAGFCKEHSIDLVVVGPEAPLCSGFADELRAKGISVFGPSKSAAELEGSKAFAKEVMRAAGVPTAEFEVFSDLNEAIAHVEQVPYQIVIKADGLAGGKGVVLPTDLRDTIDTLRAFMSEKKFGEASTRVVLEERMRGRELSFMLISDAEKMVVLPTSRDYKRLSDADVGPNTGGMGAVSPAPNVSPETLEQCGQIARDVLAEMRSTHGGFRGFLYIGFMLTESGPKVLEFNVRLGDPETQALMTSLGKQPIAQILFDASNGNLAVDSVISGVPSACVVMASEGYPVKPITNRKISIDDSDAKFFYAGVEQRRGVLYSTGGRVLSAVGSAQTLQDALKIAYAAVDKVKFEGAQYRTDIGS